MGLKGGERMKSAVVWMLLLCVSHLARTLLVKEANPFSSDEIDLLCPASSSSSLSSSSSSAKLGNASVPRAVGAAALLAEASASRRGAHGVIAMFTSNAGGKYRLATAGHEAARVCYSMRWGYPYFEFFTPDPIVHRNWDRIPHILRLFDQGWMEWVVYFDGDAYVREINRTLEHIIDLAQSLRGGQEECDFIAQDYPHLINSGVFFIRNTAWSRAFLHRWLRERENIPPSVKWTHDQGPLQNIVLHYISNLTGISYNDECWRSKKKNLCYKEWMDVHFKIDQGSRSRGKICLTPQREGIVWHAHRDYKPGHFIKHDFKPTYYEGAEPLVPKLC